MEGSDGKKKTIIINLSVLFTNLADSFASSSVSSYSSPSYNTNHSKSPRIFQNTSVVGLSIVAAMMTSNDVTSTENILSSPPSRPIPIVCSSSPSTTEKPGAADYDVELSESYTCVVSQSKRNDNWVHKGVFFDDADGDDHTTTPDHGLFFASSSPMNVGFGIRTEFWRRDFLSSCFLCTKKLHGLDIFMYRGEKAFCSAECRDKHIRSDDLKDNCGSEARKQLEFSVSPPCSGPQPIAVA